VFRGTRLQVHSVLDVAEIVLINQDDLRTDSRFLPVVSRVGGRVHSGFLNAFSQISDLLDARVQAKQPGQALWLAGHSLGGALATLAAAHLGRDTIQGLYTYGCPRVGDAVFAAVLPQQSYYRFVHRDDWVTTVPPEILGYVHAGTRQPVPGSPPRSFLDDLARGAGELASALTTIASQLRLSVGGLPFKVWGLADHAPIYYATLLWNALLSAGPAI
jgi:pimeloyl-ACP methyl ester carboxylesterase